MAIDPKISNFGEGTEGNGRKGEERRQQEVRKEDE